MHKSEFYRDKTVIITGGAGSIGSELCFQLLGFDVSKLVILDQSEYALHCLDIKYKNHKSFSKVELVLADIRNITHVHSIFNKYKPEIVFHAAALKQLPALEEFPSEAVLTNIMGTKNIAEAACKTKVEKVICISTDKAVEPISIMGITKQIVEHYINRFYDEHTKFSIARFGNLYNSKGSAIELFNQQIELGGPVTITDPRIERYFMSIEEACKCILNVSLLTEGGETFVIDMGPSRKIVDVIIDLINAKGRIPHKDIEIKTIGLRKGEKLKEKLVNDFEKLRPTSMDKISYFKPAKGKSFQYSDDLDEIIDHAKERNDNLVNSKLKRLSDLI